MNFERYPWLQDLSSPTAQKSISEARQRYLSTGAATFPSFITPQTLSRILDDVTPLENDAYTTDDYHTPHQLPVDDTTPYHSPSSVRNFLMRTQVASIAYDELRRNNVDSVLVELYRHPTLRRLVAGVTGKTTELHPLDCPVGACTVNVFRTGYHHSFHFDESEFSTTLMIREAGVEGSGLFQYTNALREGDDDLALEKVAAVIESYHLGDDGMTEPEVGRWRFDEGGGGGGGGEVPVLRTLEFKPGTLSIFSGSRSLHRVTRVEGDESRLVAVLTFSSEPGFRNSKEVQKMFWGRCV